jgi:kynurenine 3-monooxygenase
LNFLISIVKPSNFKLLFGADGAYSAARLQHHLQHDRFQYSQYYIDFGYKELNIPAGEGGSFRMEKMHCISGQEEII